MRPDVKEALDRLASQGVYLTGPEAELDKIVLEDGKLSFTTEGPPKLTITEGVAGAWYHAYVGVCTDLGGSNVVVVVGSVVHPEQLIADGTVTWPIRPSHCECTAYYVRSFDHEPTEAERDLLDEVVLERYVDFWNAQPEDEPE